jgi:threonine/homoserine efflux transporter RhtA
VSAPLISLVPPDAQFYITRFVSLLCGVLTLVLLWRSMRALWPNDPLLAALATGFAALWPLHQSVGAMTNNDAMAGLAAAAVFHHIAQIGGRGWRARDAAILGLFCGLGVLSKSTSLVLGIVALGAAWHFSGMNRAQPRVLDVQGKTVLQAKLKSRAQPSHRAFRPRYCSLPWRCWCAGRGGAQSGAVWRFAGAGRDFAAL